MNYIILIGIALFLLASALDDDDTGWIFSRDSMSFRVSDGDYTLRVKGEGDIDLAPDGSGVAALSSSGSLDVHMTRNGAERRVLFSSEDGTVIKQFFVAGEAQTWSPEADRFVAEAMPIVLRETALSFEERVAWLIENRGQNGLLDEIELIQSDFAQRVYSVQYAKVAEIAPADLQRLIGALDSNMSSDFDLRTTLSQLYDEERPDGASLVTLLAAGESLGSDFDARVLLEHVGSRMPNTPEATTAYLDVAATINSDFDLRTALAPFVSRQELDDDLIARAIDLAGDEINSDFDLRVLLAEAAPRVGASDTLARAYTEAVSEINSDFDHRATLTMLAESAELSAEGWRLLLDSAAEGLNSDFDCATVLVTVAPSLPADDAVVAAYRRAMDTIGSDFDRQRALVALDDAGRR
jgi:hypothetical protein